LAALGAPELRPDVLHVAHGHDHARVLEATQLVHRVPRRAHRAHVAERAHGGDRLRAERRARTSAPGLHEHRPVEAVESSLLQIHARLIKLCPCAVHTPGPSPPCCSPSAATASAVSSATRPPPTRSPSPCSTPRASPTRRKTSPTRSTAGPSSP